MRGGRAELGDEDPRPVMSSDAVDAAAHSARVCTRCEYIVHVFPDGEVNERWPYTGFWERFMSSLETRWDHIKRVDDWRNKDRDGREGQTQLVTDGGVDQGTEEVEQIRVAVPRADSQGECYHAAGGPCGSHLLRNVETTVEDLRAAGLYPCTNCMEKHGLPVPDGESQ